MTDTGIVQEGSHKRTIEVLAARTNLGAVAVIESIKGGRNSSSYLVRLETGVDLVVKLYPDCKSGGFDRRASEENFLEYASAVGISNVPKIVATDETLNASAFNRINGVAYEPAREVGMTELEAMAEFLRALNQPPSQSFNLRLAAESCFTIEDHLRVIESRVHLLVASVDRNHCSHEAKELILHSLAPIWSEVRVRALEMCADFGLRPSELLAKERRRVSPSDFGLHNALRDPYGRIHFLDFEYAGMDDPAKLICDTLHHPRNQIPRDMREQASAMLSDALRMTDRDNTRANVLAAPYLVKWVCIVLNLIREPRERFNPELIDPSYNNSVRIQVSLAQSLLKHVKVTIGESSL